MPCYLKYFHIKTPSANDPAIPLLDIYPGEMKTDMLEKNVFRDIHIRIISNSQKV